LFGLLHRGAGDVAIRAEHATVTCFRSEKRAAMLAFVIELAGVGWHGLTAFMAAFGACKRGLGDNGDGFRHTVLTSA
jgi:hypothetical protein